MWLGAFSAHPVFPVIVRRTATSRTCTVKNRTGLNFLMWKLKLKLKHDDCPIVNRCHQFGVTVYSYPAAVYLRGGQRHTSQICFMQGPAGAKAAYLADLKDDPAITRLEVEGDLFTYEYRLGSQGQHVQLYYSNEMLFVEPVLNSPDGHEYWHVASWDKDVLSQFWKDLQANMDYAEMLSFGQAPLKNVYFPNIMPKLAPAQLRALCLAYDRGYYAYPRKATLRQLAALAGVSLSTFQESLRKAEAILLPKLVELHVQKGPQLALAIKARLQQVVKRKPVS